MLLRSAMKALRITVASLALAASPLVQAVQFAGSQTGAGTWTYDLTYNPFDNYSVIPVATYQTNLTTITLTGLFGVTSATGPTSTTFDDTWLSAVNLAWTPTILESGTKVTWTHVGTGTGNFDVDISVTGFTIFASGAMNGIARYATDGFSTDTSYINGVVDRDVTGRINGPVAAVPEPETYAMLLAGLGLMGFIARRRRT